jgi:gamma-glutamylputrescine oxidase
MYVDTGYLRQISPAPPRAALVGNIDCDACIVGAGFTGLAAALRLADAGLSVVVLDAERVAWGASGRNAGQILNGFRRDPTEVLGDQDPQTNAEIARMLLLGPRLIRDNIRRFGLDPDYRPGTALTASTAREQRALQVLADTWAKAGHADFDLLEGAETTRVVRPQQSYRAILLDRTGGHFNPLKYCVDLAKQLETLGVRIFEGSRVQTIDREGDISILRVTSGSVRAKHTLLCCNAYIGSLAPTLSRRSLVAASQQIVTEPLGSELMKDILPAGASIEEGALDANYYRPLSDGRLLFGAGLSPGPGDQKAMLGRVMPRLNKLFPQLRDVRTEIAWSCSFLLTRSHLPLVGRLTDGCWYAMGYNAFGVAFSHIAGTAMADAILGDSPAFRLLARIPNGIIPGSRAFQSLYIRGGYVMAQLAGVADRLLRRA